MFFSLNGEPFFHIFPSQLFPSLANSKQCSYIRMEHGNYHLLSWVGALARSYLPSVAGEWWLVAVGTLGWLAHRRQGRLLLQRENQSGIFHISIFIFDTTKLKSLFHCSFVSSRHCINKLHYDWELGLIWLVDRYTKRMAKGGVECSSTKQTYKERKGDLHHVNERWCQAQSNGYERSVIAHVGGYGRFKSSALSVLQK